MQLVELDQDRTQKFENSF